MVRDGEVRGKDVVEIQSVEFVYAGGAYSVSDQASDGDGPATGSGSIVNEDNAAQSRVGSKMAES